MMSDNKGFSQVDGYPSQTVADVYGSQPTDPADIQTVTVQPTADSQILQSRMPDLVANNPETDEQECVPVTEKLSKRALKRVSDDIEYNLIIYN